MKTAMRSTMGPGVEEEAVRERTRRWGWGRMVLPHLLLSRPGSGRRASGKASLLTPPPLPPCICLSADFFSHAIPYSVG